MPGEHGGAAMTAGPLAALPPGRVLEPLHLSVSAAGNERYWRSAGVSHPALDAGVLYPPLAANLTILLVQQVEPHPLLHTRQHLATHGAARVDDPLVVTGRVADRYEKRGRTYVVVEARIEARGRLVWESRAHFTPA